MIELTALMRLPESNVKPGPWDVLSSADCIENHLEKLVFKQIKYGGEEYQRKMAILKVKDMEFQCQRDLILPGRGRRRPTVLGKAGSVASSSSCTWMGWLDV